MAVNLPPCPASLKPIAHYLKCAQEHDNRDPVVSYWARLHSVQVGMKLGSKQPEETTLLLGIMTWLEKCKTENPGNEAISNEVVAQAYLENYAHKLFTYADQQDRASNFGKNVVKAFYTAGLLYDIMLTFGELSDEAQKNGKYAKWKAAYIHNCLKNGETPVPGPLNDDEETNEDHGDEAGPSNNQPEEPVVPYKPPSPGDNNFVPASIPANYDASTLPSPPVDPETRNPGGFQPYVSPEPAAVYQPPQPLSSSASLTPEQLIKAQKYCKWAGSALTYEDVKSAIENLQKGLHLLQFGKEM